MPTTVLSEVNLNGCELLEKIGIDDVLSEVSYQLGIPMPQLKEHLAELMPKSIRHPEFWLHCQAHTEGRASWLYSDDDEYRQQLGI